MAEEVADVPVEGEEEYEADHEPESPGPQAEPSAAAGYTAEFEADAEEEVAKESSQAAVGHSERSASVVEAQPSTSGPPPAALAGAKQPSSTSLKSAPAAGHKAVPSVIKPQSVAAQSSKGSVGGNRTAASPGRGKLTFTGPPAVGRARPMQRNDFSHNTFEVMKINADNMKLCNRLVEISRAAPSPAFQSSLSVGSAAPGARLSPANIAPANINRARKEDRIAQENLALYKRLQAVKPSRDVSRDTLAKDFKAAQGYSDNARKFRTAPMHPTPSTSQ